MRCFDPWALFVVSEQDEGVAPSPFDHNPNVYK